jgi:uncharacterized protein (TIGR00369 family)
MTGNKTDRLNDLLAMFNQRAPIAHIFGMRLSFNQQREAIVDLPYNPALNHAQGGIHGGICATLLDSAGWFAAAASHAEQCWIATHVIPHIEVQDEGVVAAKLVAQRLEPFGGGRRVYPSFGAANPSGLESAASERLDAMRPEGFAPNARYTRGRLGPGAGHGWVE